MPAFKSLALSPAPSVVSISSQTSRRRLLAAFAAAMSVPATVWSGPALATRSARSSRQAAPLILAQEAPPDIDPAGWLVSEKFDGVRAWWDGLVLRFRSGLIVAAPAAFLKALPPTPLDGELWLGRGRFDELSGIVRRGLPDDSAWQRVRYMAFEMPGAGGRFEERALRLQQRFPRGGDAVTGPGAYSPVCAVPHFRCVDHDDLKATLERVVAAGGEGLMLHRADAPDIQGRSPLLLKLKPLHDDEAVVVGYQAGFGRLSGRMGALQVLDDEGRQFEVGTGFSDAQRLSPPAIGTRITFTHHGRTPSGVPRFASFLRERPL